MTRYILWQVVALLLLSSTVANVHAGPFIIGQNVMRVENYENQFDAAGNFKTPGSGVAIGDHFVGILNITAISVGGLQTYFPGPMEQLTGIFAQRVENILFPDPFGSDDIHIVLGAPTATSFIGPDGSAFSTSPFLSGLEMFALFHQTGAGTTVFESNGSSADDVAKATDGSKLLTLGYSPGVDTVYGTPDDDGYMYTHVDNLTSPLQNFSATSFGGLNVIFNGTEHPDFLAVNDPNEAEVDKDVDVYLESLINANQNSTGIGGNSPWQFQSRDPAVIHPVPEPGSLALLCLGALGAGLPALRRRQRRRQTHASN